MSADAETLAFYDREAAAYADRAALEADGPWLARFLAALPPRAEVLDFGAGPGWAAGRFASAGHDVLAFDLSPGLLAEAERRYGVRTRVGGFADLDDDARYDAVWASFCLLHAPRPEVPGHLARIRRALRPGGLVYVGLKEGAGEQRDRFGRFYVYYRKAELEGLLAEAGFAEIELVEGAPEPGFDGVPHGALHAYARRPDDG